MFTCLTFQCLLGTRRKKRSWFILQAKESKIWPSVKVIGPISSLVNFPLLPRVHTPIIVRVAKQCRLKLERGITQLMMYVHTATSGFDIKELEDNHSTKVRDTAGGHDIWKASHIRTALSADISGHTAISVCWKPLFYTLINAEKNFILN